MGKRESRARFAALQRASRAWHFGARYDTLTKLTGLHANEVRKYFCVVGDGSGTKLRFGARPNCTNFFFQKGLVLVHASFLAGEFERAHALGLSCTDSLLAAYERYCERFGHDLRISFDRAFDLIDRMYAIWDQREPSIGLASCPRCKSRVIAPLDQGVRIQKSGDQDKRSGPLIMKMVLRCPFCALQERTVRASRNIDNLALPAHTELYELPLPHPDVSFSPKS